MARAARPWARLAALAVALGALLASPASGAGVPADPPADIPLGLLPAACAGAPRGAVCENASIARLDAAHAKLGLGPYRLPSDFDSLLPPRQLLILADLDRTAYRLHPIGGLSRTLDAVAEQGALARRDPDPGPQLLGVPGQVGYASNWAGGAPNAPVAYFEWMYDDGYGSGNLDCTSPSAPGCWGHRHTILAFGDARTLTMGAAVAVGEASYTLTVVATEQPIFRYSYTWAQVDLPASVKYPGAKTSKSVPAGSIARTW